MLIIQLNNAKSKYRKNKKKIFFYCIFTIYHLFLTKRIKYKIKLKKNNYKQMFVQNKLDLVNDFNKKYQLERYFLN